MTLKTLTILCILFPSFLPSSNGYILDKHSYNPYDHRELHLQDVILHPASLVEKVSKNPFEDVRKSENSLTSGDKTISSRSSRIQSELPIVDNELGVAVFSGNILKSHWSNLQSKIGKMPPYTELWQILLSILRVEFYLPSRETSLVQNEQCISDLDVIYSPATKDQWPVAMQMVDSWGKLPDGLFFGNNQAPGAFDECLVIQWSNVSATNVSTGSFKGKYCSIMLKDGETSANVTKLQMPAMIASLDYPALYSLYGTCMPSSCTQEDLHISLNYNLAKWNKSVSLIDCQTEDPPDIDFTAGQIVMICLLSLFAFLLLSGAAIDTWIECTGKTEMRRGPMKYLLVFSISTNLYKMFQINTAENKEAITSLYGMRVLSMTWVVWCHQYMMVFILEGNKFSIGTLFHGNWLDQILMNGYPSVDSFFFMSGLLVAYGILKEKELSGSVNLFIFYFHRFIRLTIPICLLSGFMATLSEYLGHGPYAFGIKAPHSLQDLCQKYWWRDALFITNYFVTGDDAGSCLGVCWYTAVDFQIFLLTPLILFPFIWREWFKTPQRILNRIECIWLGIVIFVSVLIPGIITGIGKLPPTGIFTLPDQETSIEYNEQVYMASWCRAQPYLVGMALGVIFRRDAEKKIKLEMWQVLLGWCIATATGLAVLFGMYDYNQLGQYPGYHWADSIFYGSLHRLAWGLALAWVVFACHYGYAGPVNTFLSHPSWQPLSRLTYCMFLVAIPVQEILFVFNDYYPLHFGHLDKVLQTVGALFVSGIGAVLLSLCTEAPVMGLEKLLLRRGKTKT
ncbi:nose resistant to fluoxetine protein 6-like isoform X1 [Palaemon carinicauda]|uniref:nose resistant to fluoxetine protein 6-like isoform X1 n=1 Tax=Palaemon carinicauda TaxID=392227 RepID=UPI0035B69A48